MASIVALLSSYYLIRSVYDDLASVHKKEISNIENSIKELKESANERSSAPPASGNVLRPIAIDDNQSNKQNRAMGNDSPANAKSEEHKEGFISLAPLANDDHQFVDNKDGTITDHRTGLMWTKSDSFIELGEELDWYASVKYTKSLTIGGFNDWRIPTVEELKTLYDVSHKVKAHNYDTWGHLLHYPSVFSEKSTFIFVSEEAKHKCCAGVVYFGDPNDDGKPRVSWPMKEHADGAVRAVRSVN